MIGIVIVSYKNIDGTVNFINDQLSKISLPWKAVVVENSAEIHVGKEIANRCCGIHLMPNSTDALLTSHRVFVISSLSNLGFARGNNLGAEFLLSHFKCDYLLFTNDDIIIENKNVIEIMIKSFQKDERIAVVGPQILGVDGVSQSPHYKIITPQRQIGWKLFRFLRRKKRHTETKATNESGYCYWASGCFFLVKAIDFQNVKGFDSRTFLYTEEAIFAERLRKIDRKEYFCANTKVLHLGGCSTKNLKNKQLRRYLKQSNNIYYINYLRSNPIWVWLYNLIC